MLYKDKNGYIQSVTNLDMGVGDVISVPEEVYVLAGWIDLQTHAYPNFEPYCSHPDKIGYKSGVTTVVDAGTCGANHIEHLYETVWGSDDAFGSKARASMRIQLTGILLSVLKKQSGFWLGKIMCK